MFKLYIVVYIHKGRVPEEAQRERGLAGAGAAHDAQLVARRHAAREAAQRGRARAVAQRQRLQLQRARGRPRRARPRAHAPRRLLPASYVTSTYYERLCHLQIRRWQCQHHFK